jgi:hypothetical protein
MAITDYHRLIFEYLEEYRTTHPDENFTYLLRAKNSSKRPRTEYLFTGDKERYILVGLYLPNNGRTKTRSIGLLFEYDREKDRIYNLSLEIVFDDPKLKQDYSLYEAILNKIGIKKFKEFSDKRYSLSYPSLDWKENIKSFLTNEWPLINDVIKDYNRGSAFFIPAETLDADIEYLRQNMINQSWKYSAQNSNDWEWIYDNQTIGLNYNNSNIPDLTQFKSVLELETHLDVVGKRLTYLTHLMNFKDAKNGEVVLTNPAKTTVGAIGVFSGPYQYYGSGRFEHSRSVEWLATKPWEYKEHSIKDYAIPFANDPFCSAVIGPEIIEEYVKTYPEYRTIFEEKGILKTTTNPGETPAPSQKSTTRFPKNTILYGPPGTGKTYSTIGKAVEIIDRNKGMDHAADKRRFDELRKAGQIEFITFHQNYTYEDFVLGIKPALNEGEGSLRFSRHEGIFYKISQRATKNYELTGQSTSIEQLLPFEEVFEEFIQPLEEEGNEIQVAMKSSKYFYLTEVGENAIDFRKASGGTAHSLSIATLKRIYEGGEPPLGLTSYYTPLVKLLTEKGTTKQTSKEPLKNYVLIIDEINRANMSRVFGELITLLEEDKRLGAENELKVTLPSGEQFAVPPNLYIIGTMNTADKSLALLDIALRRRFEFEGMYPQYELPGMDKETGDILKNLNNAIHEQKKSADFLVGHAYFLNKKRGELRGIFEKRVIPLLMEYFSGRTEMAREVLQKAGIKTKLCDFSYQLLIDDDTL